MKLQHRDCYQLSYLQDFVRSYCQPPHQVTALITENLDLSKVSISPATTTNKQIDKSMVIDTTSNAHLKRLVDLSHLSWLGVEVIISRNVLHNGASIYAITLPPKVWYSKPTSRYIPPFYSNDIYEWVFSYSHYGHSVYRPKSKWNNIHRTDIITYNDTVDKMELETGLIIGKSVPMILKKRITTLIITYLDHFFNEGAKKTILDYAFAIDTGVSQPVFYRKPPYEPHENLLSWTISLLYLRILD